MKRYKRLMVMAAVLVAACIATFALTQYEEKQEQIRTSDEIILQIPTDTVRSLSWEYSGGGSLAFNKTDDGWKYQDDEAFPVSVLPSTSKAKFGAPCSSQRLCFPYADLFQHLPDILIRH